MEKIIINVENWCFLSYTTCAGTQYFTRYKKNRKNIHLEGKMKKMPFMKSGAKCVSMPVTKTKRGYECGKLIFILGKMNPGYKSYLVGGLKK